MNSDIGDFLLSTPVCPAGNFTDGHMASIDYPSRGIAGMCFAAMLLLVCRVAVHKRMASLSSMSGVNAFLSNKYEQGFSLQHI